MGARAGQFAPGEAYHVYSRGVERRALFLDEQDYMRFFRLLAYYLPADPVPSFSIFLRLQKQSKNERATKLLSKKAVENLVGLLCYCLMPNHVHLLLHENVEQGVSRYLQRLLNSYARYFNNRRGRDGSLFGGRFHAVHIATTEQLLHVSRYIHLNPYVAGLVSDPLGYRWSSLGEYIGDPATSRICETDLITSVLPPDAYRSFVLDHAGYARDLARAQKEVLIDAVA